MRKSKPDAVDAHVGARIRLRRMSMGMSQEKLASNLGVTFQQVQKYEKGTNRVSCGMLQKIADALNVSTQFFFEDQGGRNSEYGMPANFGQLGVDCHKLIATYNNLDSDGRNMLWQVASMLGKVHGMQNS